MTSALEEIRNLFTRADTNSDKSICFDELRRVLLAIGTPGSDIPLIFGCVDKNNDGKVDWNEFVGWVWSESPAKQEVLIGSVAASKLALTRLGDTLRKMGVNPDTLFACVDLDKNGFLNKVEFRRVLMTHDPTLTRSLVDAAFDAVDVNLNGWLDTKEFCEALSKDWARQTAEVASGTAEVMVQVPENTWPPQLMLVRHAGNEYHVPVPPNKYPGSYFTVTLLLQAPAQQTPSIVPTSSTELLVTVPPGVSAGGMVAFNHGGNYYTVPAPIGSCPGSRFKVTVS